MTDKERFEVCCRLSDFIMKCPAGDTRTLLVDALYVIHEQQRDIEALTVSLHDLAKEVDFGQ